MNYLEMAKQRRLYKNKITNEDIKYLSINDFVCKLYHDCDPASYGKQMEHRLTHDTENLIRGIKASDERGEYSINGKVLEIKTSYFNRNGYYRITNMRPWQEIDYYVLFFVDCDNDFKLNTFLIKSEFIYNNSHITAQDNSKKINEHNQYYNVCTNLKPEFLKLLEKENVLRGTDYNDLVDYIYYMNGNSKKRVTETITKERNKAVSVSFRVNDSCEISGKSNIESVAKLSQMIGYENIVGKFWDSQLSRHMDKTFNVPIGGGYYLNPKFSIRDIRTNIKSLNKKTGLNVKIIERPKRKG